MGRRAQVSESKRQRRAHRLLVADAPVWMFPPDPYVRYGVIVATSLVARSSFAIAC
jgi:hypothetical protein